MQNSTHHLTNHARNRSEQRGIPSPVIGLILDYGDCRDAGEGARKYALSKDSLRELKRDLGKKAPSNLDRFRKAYVVSAAGKIITVAFAHRPIFH